jgi:hypothetical protein
VRNALLALALLLAATGSGKAQDDPLRRHSTYSTQFQPTGSRLWDGDDSKAAKKCDEIMGKKLFDLSTTGNPQAKAVEEGSRDGTELWASIMAGCLAVLGRTDIKGFVTEEPQ